MNILSSGTKNKEDIFITLSENNNDDKLILKITGEKVDLFKNDIYNTIMKVANAYNIGGVTFEVEYYGAWNFTIAARTESLIRKYLQKRSIGL